MLNAVAIALSVALAASAHPPAATPNPYLVQARIFYQGLDYEAALARLKKAARWERGSSKAELVEIHLYSGLCHYHLGDEAKARAAFRSALALDREATLPPLSSPKVAAAFAEEAASAAGSPARDADDGAKGRGATAAPAKHAEVPKPDARATEAKRAEGRISLDEDAPAEAIAPAREPVPALAASPIADGTVGRSGVPADGPATAKRWWPAMTAAAACLAATGTAVALGLSAQSKAGAAEAEPFASNSKALYQDAQKQAGRANLLYGVAGGAAALSVALYFVF